MDEVQLSIVAAWKRLLPKLLDDPHQLHSRLKRNASFTRPPRPWCLAIRANDTRLPVGWPAPAADDAPPRLAHFITRDHLVRLCSPVHLPGTGHTIEQVASLLGVTRGSLLTSRVKGLFKTTHLPALDGRWGKPHPLLSCSLPLDPSISGFVSADPLWSWTSTFLTSRIPADLPTQALVRIPRYHDRAARYRDTDPLHPEQPHTTHLHDTRGGISASEPSRRCVGIRAFAPKSVAGSHSVPHLLLLRVGNEIGQRLGSFLIHLSLVLHQMPKCDAAVLSYFVKRDLAFFKQGNEKWARDVQKVGRLLGCQFGVNRDQGDRIAFRHFCEDTDQQLNRRCR